jgi:translocation and assembly module TamB
MSANLSVLFAEQGKINGTITLPLTASIPPQFKRSEQIKGSVKVDILEKGLLSALFPGFMQESKGDIKVDIKMDGTWIEPRFYGNLGLKNAGAYIPSAGITIKDVHTEASFEKDMVQITKFSAVSSKGSINGNAELRIKQWKIKNYQGQISGNDFQTIYLPELHVVSSPKLKFIGGEEKLSISGDILISELLISGEGSPEIVKPSNDVYIVDIPEAEKRKPYFDLDLKVRISLGKKVLIKKAGVNAQLDGDIVVTGKSFSEMNARGLINITKGTYKRYGIDLEITRGRIIFSGGPVENPSLDILALRKVGDVHAGISISGTVQSPVVALYAKPSMPDTDILAYIILGRPLGKSKDDSKLAFKAAKILLSQSESASLQDQIKDIAGLDVLEIESEGEDVSRSIITIGKYLTPELYISFGQSLAGGGDVIRLRYSISKRIELETQSGEYSGVDLYYKIDFK